MLAAASLVLPLAAQGGADAAHDAVSAMFRQRAERRAAFRNEKVRNAIHAGLDWLLAHQDDDGHWDADDFMKHDAEGAKSDGPGTATNDIGVTALALLALLAEADPAHLDACHLAADWLGGAFDLRSGHLRSDAHDFIYSQALATIAMAEAAALLGRERHRDAAILGLHYLEAHRNPGAAWRYQPHDSDNDTSVTAWCLAAYAACRHAGIEVPATSVGEALAWLDSVTNPATGHAGYVNPGETSSRMPGDHGTRFPPERGEAMTAAALHARLLCGAAPDGDLLRAGAALLTAKPPTTEAPAVDFYYWLHGSMAMSQLQGTTEQRRWEQALHKTLLALQKKDGPAAGSWDPTDVWGGPGGRIYSTAAVVLCLSSSYRLGATDALAQIPDAPPFRRVYGLWKKGTIGAAAAALALIPAADTPGEMAFVRARIEWYAAVEVAHAERLMATLDKVRPDVLDQCDLLEQITASLAPLPVATAAGERLDAMRRDPKMHGEVLAAKELRALQKTVDAALASKNARQRQKVREQLQKLAAKYPDTKATEKANAWIQQLQ
ncbi:MAG TPA: hypothetical protein VFZ65_16520 [Planctomycetota bacterium]|nr:hypothetical protein [Planctomycetota bacterium]